MCVRARARVCVCVCVCVCHESGTFSQRTFSKRILSQRTFSHYLQGGHLFVRAFTINIIASINTKQYNVMYHIIKFANTDVTYSPQLLYAIVIVYVIEFYSIYYTNVMITNKCLIL